VTPERGRDSDGMSVDTPEIAASISDRETRDLEQ
jgi:hypothetical protein